METYGLAQESIATFIQPYVVADAPSSSVGIREQGEITRANL